MHPAARILSEIAPGRNGLAGPADDSLGRVSPRTGETARLILSVRIFSREYEGSHGSIFLWRAQRIRSRDI
jgi:hypothetical protein